MPKGVIQHLHFPACLHIPTFLKLCHHEKVFLNEKNELKVFHCKEDEKEGFTRVTKLMKEEGEEVIEYRIKKQFLLNEQKFDQRDTKEIFFSFGDLFPFIFIVFYLPFFQIAMDCTISLLENDNAQGLELRTVFGMLFDENKTLNFEDELNIYQKFEDDLKKKTKFKIDFIQTGLKIDGKEKMLQSLSQYESSMISHPNLIKGFDLVHYEDLVLLDTIAEELQKAKERNPKIQYYFHAGETVNKENNNVIDALLLGSKRLGHGLAVARSPILIEMIKKQDVCVEVNPLSNYMLGYVRDLRWHPANVLISNGVKITINPDDYMVFQEEGVSMDYFLCFLYLGFDLRDVKWCLSNSINYSTFSKEEKEEIWNEFNQKWSVFIEEIIKNYI